MQTRLLTIGVFAVAFSLALAGCQSQPAKPKPQAKAVKETPAKPPVVSKEDAAVRDRCFERLSDIGGLFLMYGLSKRQLPATLDELRAVPGASNIGDFVCPASGQPYIYDPQGKPAPSGVGLVIVADPTPAHSGMRLCIVISENPKSGSMLTKVVALPESFFQTKE